MGPPVRHLGVAASVGVTGSTMSTLWGSIEFGFWSYWYAGSLLEIGKTPVVWSIGSSLPVIILSSPEIVTLYDACGQLTLPSTEIFVCESHALEAILIQGPTTCAPPVEGKVVWHEST